VWLSFPSPALGAGVEGRGARQRKNEGEMGRERRRQCADKRRRRSDKDGNWAAGACFQVDETSTFKGKLSGKPFSAVP